MRVLNRLIAVAILSALAGCAANQEEQRSRLVSMLSAARGGLSEEQLNSAWNAAGRHQFTALIDPAQGDRAGRWLLLEYPLADGRVPYYALFKNGGLARVIDPAALEGPQMLTAERRMQAVLEAPDIAGDAIEASVSSRLSARGGGRRAGEDDEAALSNLVPRQIQLGMSINEVKARLGPPAAVSGPAMNTIVYAYGPRNAAEGSVSPIPYLSVTFVNGQVVRVFSGDFFDRGLLK
jgi:hypothetical protein